MEGFVTAPLSARAIEISKGREELLRLLHDIPESDRELSFTDLVEKGSVAGSSKPEGETNLPQGEVLTQASVVKDRKKKKKNNSMSSGGSSSDGVLLNFYLPASLTRSLTAPRSRRGMADGSAADSNKSSAMQRLYHRDPDHSHRLPHANTCMCNSNGCDGATSDAYGRGDREPSTFGCWSAFWDGGRGKSRRPVLGRR